MLAEATADVFEVTGAEAATGVDGGTDLDALGLTVVR